MCLGEERAVIAREACRHAPSLAPDPHPMLPPCHKQHLAAHTQLHPPMLNSWMYPMPLAISWAVRSRARCTAGRGVKQQQKSAGRQAHAPAEQARHQQCGLLPGKPIYRQQAGVGGRLVLT